MRFATVSGELARDHDLVRGVLAEVPRQHRHWVGHGRPTGSGLRQEDEAEGLASPGEGTERTAPQTEGLPAWVGLPPRREHLHPGGGHPQGFRTQQKVVAPQPDERTRRLEEASHLDVEGLPGRTPVREAVGDLHGHHGLGPAPVLEGVHRRHAARQPARGDRLASAWDEEPLGVRGEEEIHGGGALGALDQGHQGYERRREEEEGQDTAALHENPRRTGN